MEAEAKAFENEKKNNPEEEDHDTRKLPKPERMRLVVKNKEVRRQTLRLRAHGIHTVLRYICVVGALIKQLQTCVTSAFIRPSFLAMNEVSSCTFSLKKLAPRAPHSIK